MIVRKAIVFMLLGIASASAGLSRLEALGMIESGNNDTAIGGAGEVSRYQIKPWVWRHYSKTDAYRNRQVSSQVAEKYLAELEETFRRQTGREPEDFDLYVLWNAGPTYYAKIGFSKQRVHRVIRDRAQRFVNLRQKSDAKPGQTGTVPGQRSNTADAAAGRDNGAVLPFGSLTPTSSNLEIPLASGIMTLPGASDPGLLQPAPGQFFDRH